MAESHLMFSTSLLLSLNGLIVVFSVLVILALATILIARIIGGFEKGKAMPAVSVPAPAPAVTASAVSIPAETDFGDVVAVLQGALSLESGIPVDQLEIVSIRSVPDSAQQ